MNTHPRRPRILIPIPTSNDSDYNDRCWPQYAAAVESAGGNPVSLPLTSSPQQIAELATSCEGVLLPGSPADVNPHKYGEEPLPACSAPDAHRENVDELLLQDAHNLYKPILGICFGLQSLNVWRGGTLLQDLSRDRVDHAAGSKIPIAHQARIARNSLLAGLVSNQEATILDDGSLNLPLNSSHHQAVGLPGDNLRVTATSFDDGVIEAVEGGLGSDASEQHFVLGVQWHPERSVKESETSRAIFRRFVHEAAVWSPRAIRVSVG